MTGDNQHVTEQSEVVVISVKPHIVGDVLEEIATSASEDQLFVSVAAGVTIKSIEEVSTSKYSFSKNKQCNALINFHSDSPSSWFT